MMNINNIPEYAKTANYIVARKVDDDWWFYGAYDTHERAIAVEMEIGGKAFWNWEIWD